MAYVVTAPYVTIKVTNELGQLVLREFYAGAPVPASADVENVARLLRKGMLAEVPAPAKAEEPAKPEPKAGAKPAPKGKAD